MQLLKRAVTIIEPDELDAIDGVYADGKPILVRTEDGSRLAPSVFEVLFDDSGNYLGDHGQGLCIYYESGSYETIVPTVLSFGDGMLMADDLIDWSDLDSGITWTRGTWTRGDRNLMELRPEPTVVVDPEQYAHMELMTFGGALVAMKTAGGMVSGGGTVSDDPDADDAETEKRNRTPSPKERGNRWRYGRRCRRRPRRPSLSGRRPRYGFTRVYRGHRGRRLGGRYRPRTRRLGDRVRRD